jgi:cytochrome P450
MTDQQTATPTPVETDFDHRSQKFRNSPVATAAELTANVVSYTQAHGGFFVLGSHEAVRAAALNSAVFASGRPADQPELKGVLIPPSYHGLAILPIEADGQYHRGIRRAMSPMFSKADAMRWRERFEKWTTAAIDSVIETGSVDFARDIANPVVFIFAIEFLGLPVEDWRKWQEPAHKIVFTPPGTAEQEAVKAAWAANIEDLRHTILRRRQDPQDDFISHMATVKVGEELLSVDDLVSICVTLMLGAVDTAASVITNGLVYLDDHPELRTNLADDEDRLASAVQEFLRHSSPTHGQARTVAVDTEVNGCPMRRGDRVLLSWRAANHDPRVFEDPGTINIDRTPNPHLAYGAGPHKCVGLHFANVEALVVLQHVLRRMPDYTIDREQAEILPHIGAVYGHLSLPATFSPGKRESDLVVPDAR